MLPLRFAFIRLIPVVGLTALIALSTAGCPAKMYKESADREVEAILSRKSELVLGAKEKYDIEQIAKDPLEGLPRALGPIFEAPEELKRSTEPPRIISLRKALEITFYNSRDYQSQKEDVYLSALALTEQRHVFSAQFSGTLSSLWKKTPTGTTEDGKPIFDQTLTGDSSFGVTKLLKDGASIGIDLSSNFLRHLTGDPANAAASVLAVRIIQPLWKGAGRAVVQENLTQSERDVIYAIRSFARFRRTLAVDMAASYYRVLQQRDVVRNEVNNYNNLVAARVRTESLAKAGRLPEFQVDQARQDELRAKDRWNTAVQAYYQQLDNLKISLGLPTDANVDVDEADLRTLLQSGVRQPEISEDDSVAVALANRLDLKNSGDAIADARRKIKVAENGLGAEVNLVFDSSTTTEPNTRAGRFQWDRTTWSGGVDVTLPLDQLAERNTYRRSLIVLARAERNYSLRVDNVKLDVRQDWRALQQAKESYDIQKNSLALAERRVESTDMLLQAGRADTRDMLDARNALIEAQNAVIQALANHAIARLQFFSDLDTLTIDDNGIWLEEPAKNDPTKSGEAPAAGGQPAAGEQPSSEETKDEPDNN